MSEPTPAPSPEPATPTGVVHWLGTGLSTGSGLRALAEHGARTVLWARTVDKAAACLARLGLSDRAEVRALRAPELAAQLRPGDVLVSMLPAAEHPALLRQCIASRAHFACSSYVSPELLDSVPDAERAGLVVLTEAGVDPGIDHLLAHELVARARAAVGDGPATARFTSYCGGVPAVPNDFRYRFSWAPRGVLNALREPARYIHGGVERLAARPWEHTREHQLGAETFEVYPNRDSLPFVKQYGLPSAWRLETFIRGTLRLQGWRQSWQQVFAEIREGDPGRIADLADTLAARYPMTGSDRDRVVLAVGLDLAGDGRAWSGAYHLDVVGGQAESAMARCVSLPLAYGVMQILAGRLPAGLRRAAEDGAEARRWLAFLRARGIDCRPVPA